MIAYEVTPCLYISLGYSNGMGRKEPLFAAAKKGWAVGSKAGPQAARGKIRSREDIIIPAYLGCE